MGRLLMIGALVIGLGGVVLVGMTADEGGYRLYHPYEVPALGLFGLAFVLLVAGVWISVRQRSGR